MANISLWFMLTTLICREEAYCKEKQLVIASKETQIDVNADKTKCMVMSRDQNAGRNHNIKTDSSSFQIFGNNPNESKLYSGRN